MPDIFISNQPPSVSSTETSSDSGQPTEVDQTPPQITKRHKRFSAFCLYPEDIDFETKGEDEKVVLMLRQHVVTNLKWIFITVLMLLVPAVAQYFNLFAILPTGFDLVINLSWYLITMAYVLENFLGWYFNVYFVTNERVIDVDFYNLIDKKVSDAELDKIQDVSYTNFGIFRLALNYGDILIQTAAEVSEFDFLAVPDPEKVTKIIDDLRDKEEIKK